MLGIMILVATVIGFPFWMIFVGFRVGDRVERLTGSMDNGAAAAVAVTVFPAMALVALGAALFPRP